MAAAESLDWAEKRNALRQRTFKKGRVVVKGVSTMDCIIRNMSLTGARLALPDPHSLPDDFELFIGDEGLRRECEVKSRSGTSAGVRFYKPLTTRELGGEFMSARSMIDHGHGAEVLGDGPTIDELKGIIRIRHRKLPDALLRQLPW